MGSRIAETDMRLQGPAILKGHNKAVCIRFENPQPGARQSRCCSMPRDVASEIIAADQCWKFQQRNPSKTDDCPAKKPPELGAIS